MSIRVFKFGGALLNHIIGFEQIIKIIKLYSTGINTKEDKFIIVVSAFEKTTHKLLKAATIAEIQIENANYIINDVIQFHINIVNTLITNMRDNEDCKKYIQSQKELLMNYIKGVSLTRELSSRTKDLILSIGEMLASYILSMYLKENLEQIINFDITSVLITDDNYGSASPKMEITEKYIQGSLLPLFKHSKIIVTQGFIGATMTGEITTMGYESSNLTATILAVLLNADEFIIWSDVEGIRQYDPKLTADIPKVINRIDYDFAEYLGYSGLKLIYPKMIKVLKQFDFEVTYKSGLNPTGEYTIIGKEGSINDYNCSIMIYNDDLVTYSRSNIVNRLEADCLPLIMDFFHHPNGAMLISIDEHLFVSNSNLPTYIEQDLLETNLIKNTNMSALSLINFDYKLLAKIMYELTEDMSEQITNVIMNYQRKTANILYKKSDDGEHSFAKYFINNYNTIANCYQ